MNDVLKAEGGKGLREERDPAVACQFCNRVRAGGTYLAHRALLSIVRSFSKAVGLISGLAGVIVNVLTLCSVH